MQNILLILLLLTSVSVSQSCRNNAKAQTEIKDSVLLEIEKQKSKSPKIDSIRGMNKCIIEYYGSASTLGYKLVFELDSIGGFVSIEGQEITEKLSSYDYSEIFYYAHEICVNKKPIIVKSPVRNIIGEMNLFFLAPTEIITNNGIANENSFIFILKYYNNTFMFTGDAPNRERNVTKLTETMNNLIRKSGISYPQGLDVDVLKYPHHGNTSFTDDFLSAVKPEYVIVPNYYAAKYPNADNQAMLNKYGIKTYKQSDSSTGNIVIISDGNNISIISQETNVLCHSCAVSISIYTVIT